MACEPCIRGHRSTKCTHAKERLMVPVRKPGRPLSVCPHPPGKACNCGGITAAIPRSQKCGCGPDNNSESTASSQSGLETLAVKGCSSPTRRTFQVQKSVSSKSNGRKQSMDILNLERMNPESFNIVTALPYKGSNGTARSISDGNGDDSLTPIVMPSPLGFLRTGPGTFDGIAAPDYRNGMSYPMTSHLGNGEQVTSPVIKAETPRSQTNGSASYFSEKHQSPNGTDLGSTPRAGGNFEREESTVPFTASRSCCGGKSKAAPDAETQPERNGISNGHMHSNPLSALPNGMNHLPPFQLPHVGLTGAALSSLPSVNPITAFHQSIAQSMYFPAQTTDPSIYTYPPFYGTYQYPIQPAHWRPPMINFGAQNLGPLALGDLTPGASTIEAVSHQCTCGDACNCLGCPAHPYNDATQAYVRSAMNSMAEGSLKHGQSLQSGGERSRELPAENMSPTIPAAPVKSSCCSAAAGEPVSTPHPSSPPQAQTPSEASVASEDQAQLSASDFLFVTYPFGCEGEMGSCLCGDDCSCVGCLIHGNADTLQNDP